MADLPRPLGRLVSELAKLPGIGPRSARRLALHLVERPRPHNETLARTLLEASERVGPCARCFALAEAGECAVCRDPARDTSLVCVVETAGDVFALERSGAFRGLYHVLGGTLSPLEGRTASDLRIAELVDRVRREKVTEVVLAMDTDTEGDATAHIVLSELRPLGLRVSRLATGLPTGASLEHSDPLTLTRALEARREL